MKRRFTATPYLFLAPALTLLGIFVVYPIIAVVYYSFTDYDIVRPPVPVGLANYQKLLTDDTFWLALQHSIVYLLVTPILIVLSIMLAIVVNRALRGIHIYRALYFVPAVSGSIAIGLAWTLAVRAHRLHQQRPALVGPDLAAHPVAGDPRARAADRDAADDLGGRRASTR